MEVVKVIHKLRYFTQMESMRREGCFQSHGNGMFVVFQFYLFFRLRKPMRRLVVRRALKYLECNVT